MSAEVLHLGDNMTELDTYLGNVGTWKKTSWSLMMVALMVLSTTLAGMGMGANDEFQQDWAESIQRTSVQTADQDDQPFREREDHSSQPTPWSHPALLDPQYNDMGVMYGKVNDLSLLDLRASGWTLHVEERIGDDHDNDGIEDVTDDDDDGDGILDELEQ